MKYSKWIGLVAVIVLVYACYQPWVSVTSIHLIVGGMASSAKHNFGKPGLMNLFLSCAAVIFFLLPRIWAKRTNIFVCGFNFAWAIRNYILLTRCYGGECPEKRLGLYLLMISAGIMLLMAFLPDINVEKTRIGPVRKSTEAAQEA